MAVSPQIICLRAFSHLVPLLPPCQPLSLVASQFYLIRHMHEPLAQCLPIYKASIPLLFLRVFKENRALQTKFGQLHFYSLPNGLKHHFNCLVHFKKSKNFIITKQLRQVKEINIHHLGIQNHEDALIYYANLSALLPKALNTLLNQEAFQYLFLHVFLLLLIALHVYQ